jgi:hypothetical protein
MSALQGSGKRLGDTPPEKFVKFFTRKKAVLDEDFVPMALRGGSPGREGCSPERSGRVSGV